MARSFEITVAKASLNIHGFTTHPQFLKLQWAVIVSARIQYDTKLHDFAYGNITTASMADEKAKPKAWNPLTQTLGLHVLGGCLHAFRCLALC
jgi:hypothetical protein